MSHGASAYANNRCRCDDCKAANTERVAARREQRRRTRPIPRDVEHGASCYVNWGCRCETCSIGRSVYMATRRAAS